MSKQDFDKLVERAMKQMPGSSLMRPVVEAKLIPEFVNSKINNDYGISRFDFLLENAIQRTQEIVSSKQFVDQMSRFIDAESMQNSVKDSAFVKQLEIDITSLLSNMQLHLK